MPGTRKIKKEQCRAAILAAAKVLFAQKGFPQTTMADIAGGANVAVGTIYNYFPSKPEVVLAMLDDDVSESLVEGEALVKNPPTDPVVAVGELLCLQLRPFVDSDREVWRELVAAAVRDSEIGSSFFSSDIRLVGQLNTLLLELQARGDLQVDVDTGRTATTLYGVFFLWLMAALTNPAVSADAIRSEILTGVDLTLNGVLKRPL